MPGPKNVSNNRTNLITFLCQFLSDFLGCTSMKILISPCFHLSSKPSFYIPLTLNKTKNVLALGDSVSLSCFKRYTITFSRPETTACVGSWDTLSGGEQFLAGHLYSAQTVGAFTYRETKYTANTNHAALVSSPKSSDFLIGVMFSFFILCTSCGLSVLCNSSLATLSCRLSLHSSLQTQATLL